ncbi:uncharacterized protein LOC130770251 isoform X1 [Actinidia eriantha]|uniref:uncharacterized protein LOC130770251 isoform X1 n=1 Tax=Actinidia eriantha TaxID=165200 RepID=UPI00258E92C9|nr:uncharacterized protein LOC130770251 isoform X1 [Actinidia eriantha]XP_057483600.1 uncharacterized protein LOC130770251 isoform X1 [Actinidia eriantha]
MLAKMAVGDASKRDAEFSFVSQSEAAIDAKRGLFSWVEAESLQNLSAKYCPLVPPPRSTIAAAFSPDGKTLASTHGDHTVKVIDCQTGSCLKVLSGHRRTPWVVRFHPEHPEILASGSLDHEVRLWNAHTSECIGSRDFYRPIASIAFHAEGEVLAVASGHKLYIWHYNRRGETSSPTIVLKTRRSLRAVHFHPHGAPFLLTAEVNDLDSSDSSMTRATSPGSLRYPPPAVYVANIRSSDRLSMATDLPLMSLPFLYLPSFTREDSRTDPQLGIRPVASSHVEVGSSSSMQIQETANAQEHYNHVEMSPAIDSNSHAAVDETLINYCPTGVHDRVGDITMDAMETTEVPLVEGYRQSLIPEAGIVLGSIGFQPDRVSIELRQHQLLHSRDPPCWELPFLQGWLMGQSQSGMPPVLPVDGVHPSVYLGSGSAMLISDLPACSGGIPMVPLAMPSNVNRTVVSRASGIRDHSLHTPLVSASDPRQGAAHGGNDSLPLFSRIQSELAASLAATAAAELPCTVKLRIWSHDIKSPCDPLDAERCRLTIPHAVLCSEMGAHFSPCGRFLAACVACVLPQIECDPSLLTQLHQDVSGAGTSPTRHPISARQVTYELRIYSLEKATFGSVLVSQAIRAAHCLTSIQFSPTSEHILLAYGRRHSSLLKSIVINGETSLPIYTVLEVYRVSDMELVSVLPSAEDEVNVACFHPLAGSGLVYGTKEGKLRVLQYDGSHDKSYCVPSLTSDENMVEVEQYPRLFRHRL